MRKRTEQHTEMRWIVDDVTSLNSVESLSIDVVLDKGTLDALMCSDAYVRHVPRYVQQIGRVLRLGGRIVVVSFSNDRAAVWRCEEIYGFDVIPLSDMLPPVRWNITSSILQINEKTQYFTYIIEKIS